MHCLNTLKKGWLVANRSRQIFVTALISILGLQAIPAQAMEADKLLQQCMPTPSNLSHYSKVNIHLTYKSAPPEDYHYLRLESPTQVFLKPRSSDLGYLRNKQTGKMWFYNAAKESLTPVTDADQEHWLLSETFLNIDELKHFKLAISSQDKFVGDEYYTVTATTSANNPYPERRLSFKQTSKGCNLIRAAYFDAQQNLRKKFFFQWQELGDTQVLTAVHTEDVQTLEEIRYQIRDIEITPQISPEQFPKP